MVFIGGDTSTTGGSYRPNYTADLAVVGITAWSDDYKVYAISANGERVLVFRKFITDRWRASTEYLVLVLFVEA